jgi:hypothetical protein
MGWPHPSDSPSSPCRSPAQARDEPDPPIANAARTLAPSPSFDCYKTPPPTTPSSASLFFPAQLAARLPESLIGAPPICQHISLILAWSRYPRHLSWIPMPSSCPCAPPQHLLWFSSIADQARQRDMKLTGACLISSHASSPLQDEIDVPDHTLKSPSSRRTLSSTPSSPGSTRTPPTTTPSAHIAGDRHWNPNPQWAFPPLSHPPLDLDQTTLIRSLKRRGTGQSSPPRSNKI